MTAENMPAFTIRMYTIAIKDVSPAITSMRKVEPLFEMPNHPSTFSKKPFLGAPEGGAPSAFGCSASV